jgi:hypothetical protein
VQSENDRACRKKFAYVRGSLAGKTSYRPHGSAIACPDHIDLGYKSQVRETAKTDKKTRRPKAAGAIAKLAI